jgi:hypothetical protein
LHCAGFRRVRKDGYKGKQHVNNRHSFLHFFRGLDL